MQLHNMHVFICFLILTSLTCITLGQDYYMSTVAGGNGGRKPMGDGMVATKATFNNPLGISFGPSGDLYIADQGNNVIRRILNNGTITTFAGTGVEGFNLPSNSSPTDVQLSFCQNVLAGKDGRIVIHDTGNLPILLVDKGRVSNVGTIVDYRNLGMIIPRGLAFNNSEIIYGSNYGFQLTPNGATIAPGVNHQDILLSRKGEWFYCTSGGNLFRIVQPGFHEAKSDLIALTYSEGYIKLPSLTSMVENSNGEFIFTERNNNILLKMLLNGTMIRIAGGGIYSGLENVLATDVKLLSPNSVKIGPNEEIWFAESGLNRIRKITRNGTLITVAGSSFSDDFSNVTRAYLSAPFGVTFFANGDLVIADANAIRKVDINQIISTLIGDGYTGVPTEGYFSRLSTPKGVAVHPNTGEIYVADNHQILRYNVQTKFISFVAGLGTKGFTGDGEASVNATMNNPSSISFSSTGELFIADTDNHAIRKITNNGIILTIANVYGKAGFGEDNVLAVGSLLNKPWGVFVSKTGDIFISDTFNHRIRKIDSKGIITTLAGNGTPNFSGDGGLAISANLNTPKALVVNSEGIIFIADTLNNRIRMIHKNGTISTLVEIISPIGIALGPDNNIYIADGSRVRKIQVNCPPTQLLVEGSCIEKSIPVNSTRSETSTTSFEVLAIVLPAVLVPLLIICFFSAACLVLILLFRIKKKKVQNPSLKDVELGHSIRDVSSLIQSSDFPSEQSAYLSTTLGSENLISDSRSQNETISNKYEILEKVGQGAFGSVLKVKDKKKGFIRALKVLKYEYYEGGSSITKNRSSKYS